MPRSILSAKNGRLWRSDFVSFLDRLIGGGRRPRRTPFVRLTVDYLEDRTLLSGSIFGNVFNDLAGGGIRLASDPSVASQVVYLDLNHNGKLDSTVTTYADNPIAPATTIPISGSTGASGVDYISSFFGASAAALQVQGMPATFQNLAVNIDVTNNSPDAIYVNLVSPFDSSIPNLPVLFAIQPGQTFDGTIDGGAAIPITLAPGITQPNTTVTGTYAPQQAFTNPQFGINNTNPNGGWGLLFYNFTGDNASDLQNLQLNSWSLNFTTAEPSTTTDAAGNYSFTGLAAGTYTVALALPAGVAVTSPSSGIPAQTVTVADGQATNGVDFGVQAVPSLTSVSFSLAGPATGWGQPITINYTLTNEGGGNAPAFSVGLYLSPSGIIGTDGVLLDTLEFPAGLAAGATLNQSVTETLPAQPDGFASVSSSYVGAVIETGTTDIANQGAGIDLALLGTPSNVAVTTNSGVQQDPSVAVDPTDSNHLVTAYMDYSLTQNPTTSSLGVALGSATVMPLIMEPDIAPGAYVIIDKGLADQETVQVASTTATTFTATFTSSHAPGFTIDTLLYAGIGVAVSTDGGQTWANTSIPLPAGYDQGAAVPTVAFDAAGNVYLSFQASTYSASLPAVTDNLDNTDIGYGFQASNGIFVAKSTDGGLSWSQPAPVSANPFTVGGTQVPFDEFPDMAIDTFGTAGTNPYFGSIYVTWTRFYPAGQYPGDAASAGGSQLMLAISQDGGSTWNNQMQFVPGSGAGTGTVSALQDPGFAADDGPGSFDKFTTITVGPGGGVYVTAYAGGNFIMFTSTDGGRSTGTGSSLTSGFIAPNYSAQTGFVSTENEYVLTDPTLGSDSFRTLKNRREIVADPNQAGVLYAIAPNSLDQAAAEGGAAIDSSGVFFAVSDDGGQSWTNDFTVGAESQSALLAEVPTYLLGYYNPVLNDENGGQFPGYAPSLSSQVLASQAMPSITVAPNGDIVVIWYDTRNDPSGQFLEVWGTVSKDGGKTFSANFPVSNTSFDPGAGAFESANGTTSFYLGDQIGIAASNGTAYAVWSDTRNGSQDIFSASFNLNPIPAAPVDRFAPDFTQATATNLGTVTVQQEVPGLALLPESSDEWFAIQSGANGVLSVSVSAAAGGGNLQLALVDANGNPIAGVEVSNVLDASGNVIGQELVAPSVSGITYWLHVSAQSDASIDYAMTLGALTADFGTQVEGATPANTVVAQGGQNLYRVAVAVGGTLQVNLTNGIDNQGSLNLSILGADGQTVLVSDAASGVGVGDTESLSIPVTARQVVFLQVSAASLTAGAGDFALQFINFDEYETSGVSTLFFPTVGDPTSIAAVDLANNGKTDLVFSNTETTDALGVLTGTGTGTFWSESQYAVGPGLGGVNVTAGTRQFAVADLTGNGNSDIVVPNVRAADVSVLLGNGNGTLQPQREFDAVGSPGAVATGVFTSSGDTDAIVLQNFAQNGVSSFAFLKGNGDGTFQPPVLYQTVFTQGATGMVVGAFGNPDATVNQTNLDIIIYSKNSGVAQIFYGNGDSTFTDGGTFAIGENAFNAIAADLNGATYADGQPILDLITAGTNTGNVYVQMGDPNNPGQFLPPIAYQVMAPSPGDNVGVNGLAVADYTGNGSLDIIVTAQSRSGQGAAEVILLPGNGDGTFGTAQVLAKVGAAGNIAVGDFGNGAMDVAVADKGGVTVVYGAPLNLAPITTPASARNLGDTDHLVSQPQAIVTGRLDAYFNYTVPTEVVAGAGNQVVDISALFQDATEAGLSLQVTGALEVLQSTGDAAAGERVQVVAAQGARLTIHISSNGIGSFGVFTLDLDVLTQVVSAEVESPLPGGPLTSIVLTLQGDQLDPASAENPANYLVYPLAADGVTIAGPALTPTSASGGPPVVYDPDANLDIATGRAFPTAVRQTITLYFDDPLQTGISYFVELAPSLTTAELNSQESSVLVTGAGFAGHALVGFPGGVYQPGGAVTVQAGAQSGSLDQLNAGTAFLTQLHDDLSAELNAQVSASGDNPAISAALTAQILNAFIPGWLAAGADTPFLILWLDPVSIQLTDPTSSRTTFNLQNNAVSNPSSRTYIEVGGTVEVMVIAALSGTYDLQVSNVQPTARGEGILLDGGNVQTVAITAALRSGDRDYQFQFPGDQAGSAASSAGSGIAFSAIVLASLVGDFAVTFAVQVADSAAATATSLLTEAAILGVSATVQTQLQLNLYADGAPRGSANNSADGLQNIIRVIDGAMPGLPLGAITNQVLEQFPGFRMIRNLFRSNNNNGNNNPMGSLPRPAETVPVVAMAAEAEMDEMLPASTPIEAANPALIDLAAALAIPDVVEARPDVVRPAKFGALFVGALVTVGAAYSFGLLQDEERTSPDLDECKSRNPR